MANSEELNRFVTSSQRTYRFARLNYVNVLVWIKPEPRVLVSGDSYIK